MKRIGLIADYRHETGAGPQVAKLLRHEGFQVVEIARGLEINDAANRARLLDWFKAVDSLYNIGRNKQASAYITLAGKKIPYINHWIGSEVLDLLNNKGSAEENRLIQEIDMHLACAPWIADELRQVGIEAQVVPIVSFDREAVLDIPPPRHAILTYLLQGRAQFYGIDAVSAAARALPHVPIYIVGNDGRGEVSLNNLIYLGWLTGGKMEEQYRKCSILLRCPRHDGLSMMVVEALGKGKEVVYNKPFPHCRLVHSEEDIIRVLKEITQLDPQANLEGHQFAMNSLSKSIVGTKLRAILDKS
jgi:hypothetical protein